MYRKGHKIEPCGVPIPAGHHPLKCVQWVVLLGGTLGRMFGG